MKKFLEKITPSFIHKINHGLLKNNALGWQLQLPLIMWLWFLITLVSLPIPFLFQIEISSQSDVYGTIAVSVLIAVVEFFLFGFILIQFNTTKSFGLKVFAHGLKEQLGYYLIMFLCLTNVILFPLIIEWRKSKYMTEEEVKKEAVTYNKARHYFMDNYEYYSYFPNQSTFSFYMDLEPSNSGRYRTRQEYYNEVVYPLIAPYNDPDLNDIALKYNRSFPNAPKLYYTGDDYLQEKYSSYEDDYNERMKLKRQNYKYQFQKKSDEARLTEIKELIRLYKKYDESSSYHYEDIIFESPGAILEKYKSNHYDRCFESSDHSRLDHYVISHVHNTIMSAKYNKWKNVLLRFLINLNVALVFSIFMFVYKNVRLKEFILTIVYSALLLLLVIITTVISRTEEFIPMHTLLILFITGFIFAITSGNWRHFSHVKTTFVIISNIFFAFVPIYFFLYFYEYLEVGKYSYDFCNAYPTECSAHKQLMEIIRWTSFWGGLVLYLFAGSIIYKKAYERILALPLRN